MQYFETYTSNTVAGSGNQFFFRMPQDEIRTGRIFYKISTPGEYHYSLLFSNIIDSTFADGTLSHKNLICDEWQIHSAQIGRCSKPFPPKLLSEMTMNDNSSHADIVVSDLQEITFQGKKQKTVMPGEFFSSDPVKIDFQRDDYLCLEMTFSGEMIPYHEETLLPVFVKQNDEWIYSKQMPVAGMIGCDRPVCARIGYVGDSITQGIGTEPNSYLHWNAVLSEKMGERYAFWNLGLGYGRANDLASSGAWLYKAQQNDIVFVCYGVNDILRGFSEDQIKSDLADIVHTLKKQNKTVILQTIPPFDYQDENIEKWNKLNQYIKTELSDNADLIFDNSLILSECKEKAHLAKYGGHPNANGCTLWAEALFEQITIFLNQNIE